MIVTYIFKHSHKVFIKLFIKKKIKKNHYYLTKYFKGKKYKEIQSNYSSTNNKN